MALATAESHLKHNNKKFRIICGASPQRPSGASITELTFDILQLFGFGNSGKPPTRSARKNSSNFLRLSPVIVLPSDQTIANWKKPCSQKYIYKHQPTVMH